jgi:hypothetical protein
MTAKNPLDFVIWPHYFRGKPVPALGYDFGCWCDGKMMKLGNSKTAAMAERVIRDNYTPKSVAVSESEPLESARRQTDAPDYDEPPTPAPNHPGLSLPRLGRRRTRTQDAGVSAAPTAPSANDAARQPLPVANALSRNGVHVDGDATPHLPGLR